MTTKETITNEVERLQSQVDDAVLIGISKERELAMMAMAQKGLLGQMKRFIEGLPAEALIRNAWVARDKNRDLHLFEIRPSRSDCKWLDLGYGCDTLDKDLEMFESLSWEDIPMQVELLIRKV